MERFWDWARIIGWCTSTALLVLTIFWIGFAFFAALEQQRISNSEYQAEVKKRQEQAAQEISYRCALSFDKIEDSRICINSELEIYRDKYKSTRELELQQQSANWSLGSLVISTLALVVSSYGLLMLRASLHHTREAIQLTREVGHAQVRAYLSITPRIDEFCIGKPVTAFIKISNEGQSPAGRFRYIAAIYIRDHPIEDREFPLIAAAENQPSKMGVIHPKAHLIGEAKSDNNITSEDFYLIKNNGPKRLYIIVHVYYEDVFKQRRISTFCAYTESEPNSSAPGTFKLDLISTTQGNEAT